VRATYLDHFVRYPAKGFFVYADFLGIG